MKNLEFVEVNDSHLGRVMACINYVDGLRYDLVACLVRLTKGVVAFYAVASH